jgi:hypothetical protein
MPAKIKTPTWVKALDLLAASPANGWDAFSISALGGGYFRTPKAEELAA